MIDDILHGLGVFGLMVLLDFVWAAYVRAMAEDKIAQSAGFAVGISLLSGLVTVEYVKNLWMLLPVALGAIVGTAAAMLWARRQQRIADKKKPA